MDIESTDKISYIFVGTKICIIVYNFFSVGIIYVVLLTV